MLFLKELPSVGTEVLLVRFITKVYYKKNLLQRLLLHLTSHWKGKLDVRTWICEFNWPGLCLVAQLCPTLLHQATANQNTFQNQASTPGFSSHVREESVPFSKGGWADKVTHILKTSQKHLQTTEGNFL